MTDGTRGIPRMCCSECERSYALQETRFESVREANHAAFISRMCVLGSRLDRLEQEKDKLAKRLGKLEKELKSSECERAYALEETRFESVRKANHTAFISRMCVLGSRLARLEEEKDKLAKRLGKLEKQLKSSECERAYALEETRFESVRKANHAAFISRICVLGSRLDHLEQEKDKLAKRLGKLEKELKSSECERAYALEGTRFESVRKANHAAFNSRMCVLGLRLDRLEQEKDKLAKRLGKLEKELKSKQKHRKEVDEKRANVEIRLRSLIPQSNGEH